MKRDKEEMTDNIVYSANDVVLILHVQVVRMSITIPQNDLETRFDSTRHLPSILLVSQEIKHRKLIL